MDLGVPGRRLYAYTGGKPFDPRLPCVVFIHGAQNDHSVWILQSRYFAHHGRAVLALDLPGHSRSDGPAERTVAAIAERIAAALSPLASPRLLLAGHSLGSLIALEVARRLPARVAGVALIGTAAPMRVSDALLAATRDDPAAAMDMINVWSHSPVIAPFAVRPGNPAPGFNVVWQNLRLMQRIAAVSGAEVLPTDFAACNAYDGAIDAARALQCPALVILGSRDQMTPPKAAQSLIDACAQPQVVLLAATGHAMMAENPDGVRRALASFAQQVFAASAV
ncbi:MAG: alpha/beta hydrolase [Burkholderiales bacterium]|jgi:pimeloyl-ACP methyl ester carboxylesterase|nr:alpha/beta hydrolase [Burkholderiales bacterium]